MRIAPAMTKWRAARLTSRAVEAASSPPWLPCQAAETRVQAKFLREHDHRANPTRPSTPAELGLLQNQRIAAAYPPSPSRLPKSIRGNFVRIHPPGPPEPNQTSWVAGILE